MSGLDVIEKKVLKEACYPFWKCVQIICITHHPIESQLVKNIAREDCIIIVIIANQDCA